MRCYIILGRVINAPNCIQTMLSRLTKDKISVAVMTTQFYIVHLIGPLMPSDGCMRQLTVSSYVQIKIWPQVITHNHAPAFYRAR